MTFAFNPDDRPARIMRYVGHGALPNQFLVAVYDATTNIVTICRPLYDALTPLEQKQVMRTQRKYLFVKGTTESFTLAA